MCGRDERNKLNYGGRYLAGAHERLRKEKSRRLCACASGSVKRWKECVCVRVSVGGGKMRAYEGDGGGQERNPSS